LPRKQGGFARFYQKRNVKIFFEASSTGQIFVYLF
jgi:hypothetical protein